MQEEVWKDIPGYEGLYQININTQQVKSLERKHKGFGYIKKEIILKPYIRKDLYHSFCFCIGKKINRVYSHRLVMLIKEGPCPEGMEVCHNDGNPANNHPNNLRYGTCKENSNDAKKHGTRFNISSVVPDNGKRCGFIKDGEINYFQSAKKMSLFLSTPHNNATSLIRKGSVSRGRFKGYIFFYS